MQNSAMKSWKRKSRNLGLSALNYGKQVILFYLLSAFIYFSDSNMASAKCLLRIIKDARFRCLVDEMWMRNTVLWIPSVYFSDRWCRSCVQSWRRLVVSRFRLCSVVTVLDWHSIGCSTQMLPKTRILPKSEFVRLWTVFMGRLRYICGFLAPVIGAVSWILFKVGVAPYWLIQVGVALYCHLSNTSYCW